MTDKNVGGRPELVLPLFPFCYHMWKTGRWTKYTCRKMLGTDGRPLSLSTFLRRGEKFALNSEDERQRLILESARLYQEWQDENKRRIEAHEKRNEAWEKLTNQVTEQLAVQTKGLMQELKGEFEHQWECLMGELANGSRSQDDSIDVADDASGETGYESPKMLPSVENSDENEAA